MAAPYQHSGADVVFWVMLGLFALGEYAMQFRSLGALIRGRSGRLAERWSLVVVLVAVIGGFVGAIKLAQGHTGQISTGAWPLFAVGLVLMAIGIAIRWWAIVVLGRFFTPDVRVQADQTVVVSGPYRWVRHPSYSGLIICFVGLGLALSNWLSLAVLLVVPSAGLEVRMRREESALLASLGEPYRQFCGSRPRLFPRSRH
ncbi:MAG: methyltransferase family protein [Solirubrobacteraceae bacterium]